MPDTSQRVLCFELTDRMVFLPALGQTWPNSTRQQQQQQHKHLFLTFIFYDTRVDLHEARHIEVKGTPLFMAPEARPSFSDV